MFKRSVYPLILVLVWVAIGPAPQLLSPTMGYAQPTCQAFKETGKTVCGVLLEYWLKNGGLPRQGFPISEPVTEVSETNGKSYAVQYFERAIFELHPENAPPYNILLSLLGTFEYQKKYPGGAPGQQPNLMPGSVSFSETGKRIGGRFLQYWNANGKLPQQGFPISNEFVEKNDLDGKTYRVQYFERAVLEQHPENAPPYDVLLSQLGTFRYQAKYTLVGTPATQPPANTRVSAQVTRVIDGDTIDVLLNGQSYRVRYTGINTPETVDPNRPVGCYGPEASNANKALVEGKIVELEKDVSETDQFGRLLSYVYVGGTFVNAELVKQGYAQVSTFPPDVKYSELFRQLEQEARAGDRGLWGPACAYPSTSE